MNVRRLLISLLLSVLGALLPSLAHALSSEQFRARGAHLYDDWGVSRTNSSGVDGFLARTATDFDPVLARQSLGESVDVAWSLGEEFARTYPNRSQRAEQIFYYVRDRVAYTSDTDQFGRAEFAQNADEIAATIVERGTAAGDCEDSAFLLAVLYQAAGYRSAMVLMPGHIATLVYLPEYRRAPRKLTLEDESGWVWAEATGDTNPFGWVPESLIKGEILAREVALVAPEPREGGLPLTKLEPSVSQGRSEGTSAGGLLTLMGSVGLLWALAGRRGGPRRLG